MQFRWELLRAPRLQIVYNSKKSGDWAVAYEVFDIGNGRQAIICTSGRTSHIMRHPDGTWTVDEDEHGRVFPTRDDALDCAREIAGDPDLPPLTQV